MKIALNFGMEKLIRSLACAGAFSVCAAAFAADAVIKLSPPDLGRGGSLMRALSERGSDKSFADGELSAKDLSDLLWAANGVNRPDSGKRTAPSALNRQDIKIYVCLKSGAYLYNPKDSLLGKVSDADLRQSSAPATFVLVSDFNDRWSPLDAGIVSQNISLFCSANGLANYPHTTMDADALVKALKLKAPQTPMICNSVGYKKEGK